MKHAPVAALAAVLLLTVGATAQPVAPAPAPPEQQAAPPEKIGPPLHQRQTPSATIRRSETTGAAPKELKPSHGDAVRARTTVPPSR